MTAEEHIDWYPQYLNDPEENSDNNHGPRKARLTENGVSCMRMGLHSEEREKDATDHSNDIDGQ